MNTPWIALIGIGEDGLDGLSPPARMALMQATCVIGGERHLALLGQSAAQTLLWPSPIDAIIPQLLAKRGQNVAILATGDPLWFGVGSLILRHVAAEEIRSYPHLSAFALAANRLGLSLQDCRTLSLHGRPLETILPHLQPDADILALSWDGSTAKKLADYLCAHGCGQSRIVVLEAMGGPKERIRQARAEGFDLADILPLNTLYVHVVAGRGHRLLPLTAGLPDAMFEHDGQITKRDIRAITLAHLMPFAGQLLWDIGAGTGAISIEWLLRHPSMRAIAIEESENKTARIMRNASALGVPQLMVRQMRAPDGLSDLETPDAVFIGGGAGDDVVQIAQQRLRSGGRLVVNGVALQTQALMMRLYERDGGEIAQMQMAQAVPLGQLSGFRPAMPLLQWRWVKP